MAGAKTGFFKKNSVVISVIIAIGSFAVNIITLLIIYNNFPEEAKQIIKYIKETHSDVKQLSGHLEAKIEGGEDIRVGISAGLTPNQAILYSDSKFKYNEGDSVVLSNPTSNFKPQIKVMIAETKEVPSGQTKDVDIFIHPTAAAMLDFNKRLGIKKLKIKAYKNGDTPVNK